MPTLPNEPSLKNRKLFPLMDRIYSSLMSHMSSTGKADNEVHRVGETEAIYQLLHVTRKKNLPLLQTRHNYLKIRLKSSELPLGLCDEQYRSLIRRNWRGIYTVSAPY
jgi:hypothetical protein